ncbi:MAG: response regulator [Vulcanimicrobiota bacterium]
MNKSNKHIVIVEDNPYDREIIKRALKKANIFDHALFFEDGQEAWNFFFERNKTKDSELFDRLRAIVLDLNLPVISGFELMEKLRNHKLTKDIPIVILSSSDMKTDINHSYELGANSYVIKNMEAETFRDSIEKLFHYWLLLNKPAGTNLC